MVPVRRVTDHDTHTDRGEVPRPARFLGVACLLVGLLLAGALTGAAEDSFSTGPEVGERIPAFRLSDQHGEQRTFSDLAGPQGLLLLFYRTADW
jgi:cytochrome oxidase Cu insertion factor (SCO1/SenC/PrrC family)